jgi:hypothetical protein
MGLVALAASTLERQRGRGPLSGTTSSLG